MTPSEPTRFRLDSDKKGYYIEADEQVITAYFANVVVTLTMDVQLLSQQYAIRTFGLTVEIDMVLNMEVQDFVPALIVTRTYQAGEALQREHFTINDARPFIERFGITI